ncbi:MAG: aspartate kinase, partial [Planctomycetia bacterium]
HDVAVIVSARGHTTDELIQLAKEINPDPPARELDMLMATGEQEAVALLAIAIHALGGKATSLTGGQVGIATDSIHGKARIRDVRTERLRQVFADGCIAIIAGFQGIDEDQNITTLGRGGSDTTAVAIAAALRADLCEIYTDVDGVYTADPRLVPQARKIDQISYDEMLELASVGAGVMHSRSIEFAKKYGVVIHVRHAGHAEPGTLIRPETPAMMHVVVRGAALTRDEARITIRGVPDTPGVVHRLFDAIGSNHIVVDMIVQNAALDGRTEVSFTVAEDDLARTMELARSAAAAIGAVGGIDAAADVAKVSIVGLGMRTHSGVAERMFATLARESINILMITTSEIKISVLVDRSRALDALRALHQEFDLHDPLPEYKEDVRFRLKSELAVEPSVTEERLRTIAVSLPAMEDILVSNVEAALNQGRVSLVGAPDRPGVSARIFQAVAGVNVAVDMIVQNVGSDKTTMLTFTVLRSDLETARKRAEEVLAELRAEAGLPTAGAVHSDDRMVKLSVRGVGMRSHSGVAVRMFRVLAAAGVNVQLINTSELHITVVVDEASGPKALAALREGFQLSE